MYKVSKDEKNGSETYLGSSYSEIRENEQANTWYGYTIWNPGIEVY